jgi:hypothetical protein
VLHPGDAWLRSATTPARLQLVPGGVVLAVNVSPIG